MPPALPPLPPSTALPPRQALSKRIGWFPVSTAKVLCGMHKAGTIQELIERDGREAVGGWPQGGAEGTNGGGLGVRALGAGDSRPGDGDGDAAVRCRASQPEPTHLPPHPLHARPLRSTPCPVPPAVYEAEMLRGMRDQRRCCVATLGDGASQLPEVYETLHASILVWIGGSRLRGWWQAALINVALPLPECGAAPVARAPRAAALKRAPLFRPNHRRAGRGPLPPAPQPPNPHPCAPGALQTSLTAAAPSPTRPRARCGAPPRSCRRAWRCPRASA
jgi:hypothetical protein